MAEKAVIINCVEFKNELHKKLYIKSGAKNFNDYIKYINSNYSGNINSSERLKTRLKSTS